MEGFAAGRAPFADLRRNPKRDGTATRGEIRRQKLKAYLGKAESAAAMARQRIKDLDELPLPSFRLKPGERPPGRHLQVVDAAPAKPEMKQFYESRLHDLQVALNEALADQEALSSGRQTDETETEHADVGVQIGKIKAAMSALREKARTDGVELASTALNPRLASLYGRPRCNPDFNEASLDAFRVITFKDGSAVEVFRDGTVALIDWGGDALAEYRITPDSVDQFVRLAESPQVKEHHAGAMRLERDLVEDEDGISVAAKVRPKPGRRGSRLDNPRSTRTVHPVRRAARRLGTAIRAWRRALVHLRRARATLAKARQSLRTRRTRR